MNGPRLSAEFEGTSGIGFDNANNMYFCGNFCIDKISPDGILSTFAGNSTTTEVDGRADTASFQFPTDVCADPFGNIYVSDRNAIRKITPDGFVHSIDGRTGLDTTAKFAYTASVAADRLGNIYVSDSDNKIKKITKDGVVSVVAGTGAAGFQDGDVTQAQFSWPLGIAVDQQGNIYVADWKNYRIRKIVIQ